MQPRTSGMGLVAAWGSLMIVGFGVLQQYGYSPGTSAVVPSEWPADTAIALDGSRHNLLLFAHPRCPCTRATLGELSRLMSHCDGRVRASVVFLHPQGAAEWESTSLVRAARAIPGVDILFDEDGKLAALFGATTSGQVLLYGTGGKLLFSGGITTSRGHSGDNPGSSAVLSLVNRKTLTEASTPVFGCSLIPETRSADGGTVCPQ